MNAVLPICTRNPPGTLGLGQQAAVGSECSNAHQHDFANKTFGQA